MTKQKINPKGAEITDAITEIKSLAVMVSESVANGRSLLISKKMLSSLIAGEKILKKKFTTFQNSSVLENRVHLRDLMTPIKRQILTDINGFKGNRFKNINSVVSYLQRLDEEKKALRPAKMPSDQRVTSKVVEHSEKISALAADKRLFYETIHQSIATSYAAMS